MSEIAMNNANKSKKWFSFVMVAALLLASVFFLSKTVKDVMTTFQLKQELKIVEQDLQTLKERQSELTLEKAKLEDPGYVQNYARGTHLLSKSEEQVFILPKGR